MFDFVGIVFFFVFLIIGSVLIYTIIVNIKQWHRNNHSPIHTVPSKVVAKRLDVQHHMQVGGENQMMNSHTQTNYFVSFELENRERLEFHVKDKEYGMLAEGDTGILTYQGTRYKGFTRNMRD